MDQKRTPYSEVELDRPVTKDDAEYHQPLFPTWMLNLKHYFEKRSDRE